MKFDQESLRAMSGLILLILALVSMFTQNKSNIIEYILIALVGFLAGGSLLQKKNNE